MRVYPILDSLVSEQFSFDMQVYDQIIEYSQEYLINYLNSYNKYARLILY